MHVSPPRSGPSHSSETLSMTLLPHALQAEVFHAEQSLSQVAVPDPRPSIEQGVVVPRQQVKVWSHAESQSSSIPLHVSIGGMHDPHAQLIEHCRVPIVLQLVVHVPS
jgi:hypothetical protein